MIRILRVSQTGIQGLSIVNSSYNLTFAMTANLQQIPNIANGIDRINIDTVVS
jgi:hypothetical protein